MLWLIEGKATCNTCTSSKRSVNKSCANIDAIISSLSLYYSIVVNYQRSEINTMRGSAHLVISNYGLIACWKFVSVLSRSFTSRQRHLLYFTHPLSRNQMDYKTGNMASKWVTPEHSTRERVNWWTSNCIVRSIWRRKK